MRRDKHQGAAEAWDREYAGGRYLAEPPLLFVADIVAAARTDDLIGKQGLYIGCGNGRNYLPFVAEGLDLVGIDLSPTAIAQLVERAPDRRGRLTCGDLTALPVAAAYGLVIGIQVFQHGDRERAHGYIRAAQARLIAGGLFCARVNAVGPTSSTNTISSNARLMAASPSVTAMARRPASISTSSPKLSWTACSTVTSR